MIGSIFLWIQHIQLRLTIKNAGPNDIYSPLDLFPVFFFLNQDLTNSIKL